MSAVKELVNENQWSLDDICNHKVLQRNRLAERAYFLPKTKLLLSGEWQFLFSKSPINTPIPSSKSFDEEPWTTIEVPGHWQLQGFDSPIYSNTAEPFPFNPPYTTSDNPTGVYRKTFFVPQNFSDDDYEYRIRFEGVESAYHAFVNGKFLGYSQGSRNPAEFNATDLISVDSGNDLVVIVYRWSDGSYLEDQDMWRLSGIFRDVHLLALPKKGYINDINVFTHLDSLYENAILEIHAEIFGINGQIVANLTNKQGDLVVTKTCENDIDNGHVNFSVPISSPHKWSAEDPYLYHLEINYITEQNTYTIDCNVGFRTVELINGKISVNGVPIMFKGVNKHEHHKLFGQSVPLESVKKDLIAMKRNNINAIRCSHYPNDPRIYDLCDELGFWVIDEADLETQGVVDCIRAPIDSRENNKHPWFELANSVFTDNPEYKDAYLDRARQMVKRDINHPSIIIWSLGNESLYGENHRIMKKMINKMDSTRLIHYEGDIEAETSDMYSAMYLSFDKLEEFANKEHEKPLILCEYAYALGNGPGGLVKYQEVFRKHPSLQGGFAWEWCNHGIMHTFPDGTRDIAYGGDFPIDDPRDRLYAYDGLISSDHTETPALVELKKAYSPVIMEKEDHGFYIENVNDFIDLSGLSLSYTINCYSLRDSKVIFVKSEFVEIPQLRPKSKRFIPIPEYQINDGETWITWSFITSKGCVWASSGHEVAWYQFPLHVTKYKPIIIPQIPKQSPIIEEKNGIIMAKYRDTEFFFDKGSGKICKWKSKGSLQVIEGENNCLTFWRKLNNDFESFEPYWKQFRVDQIQHNVMSVSIEEESEALLKIVEHAYYSPPVLAWGIDVITEYKVYMDALSITFKLTPKCYKSVEKLFMPETLPRIGFELTIPERLDTVCWFGRGPSESYPDRKEGQPIGIYYEEIDNMDVYNDYPQENGNRCDTRWVDVLTAHGGEGFRAVMDDKQFGFKVTNRDISNAKHPFEIKKGPTVLRLDYSQQGMGSIFGAGVEQQYKVLNQPTSFTIILNSLS